jgi:hypothetical protein
VIAAGDRDGWIHKVMYCKKQEREDEGSGGMNTSGSRNGLSGCVRY